MGQKRLHNEDMEKPPSSQVSSQFSAMFEAFRAELDEHHDRRERVIKASRDITAASKKSIFALQRAHSLGKPVPHNISKALATQHEIIRSQYGAVGKDLQGVNAYRYGPNITWANQELVEAATFQGYVEQKSLLSYEAACSMLAGLCAQGETVVLTAEDYILGVFDTVGELMRFAITAVATSGVLPGGSASPAASNGEKMEIESPELGRFGQQRNILSDLRELRSFLEGVTVSQVTRFASDVDKKKGVMRTCVDKVENAVYGLIVRGQERPRGWVPELRDET